jgi:tetratricopeptide (TPR) repeat protein
MKRYLFLIFSLFLFTYAISEAQTQNTELIKQANQAYSKQDYAKATELYKKVIVNGYESFELYYNLGNSYFKTGQLSSAILYYEKARKLNPSDEDLNFNLKVANSRIVDKIDVIPELFIKTWSNNLVSFLNADNWAKLTVITSCLFFILLLLYLFSGTMILRKFAFWFSILFLIIAATSFVFAKHQFNDVNKIKEAIVFTPTVNIKSSPDQNSIDLFVIHEGLKVRVIDQINDWYEIRIANGSKGWVKNTDIEII